MTAAATTAVRPAQQVGGQPVARTRVFSGIQPTGLIHVGNLMGAISNWVKLQETCDCFYCIVDLHAITVPYDPGEFPRQVLDAAASNIAAGLDPDKAVVFVQSHVPEHTELAWVFNCITPLGDLQRMTQFKEKARRRKEPVNAGLLNYPVLQAADVLLYKASVVPVGEDQKQHVELMRDIARRFNSLFGETFPEPEAMIPRGSRARVKALNDPEKKMSKSIPGSYVALSDPPEVIRETIKRAVTDVGPRGKTMSPGVRNLFTLLEYFSPRGTVEHFKAAYRNGTIRYVDLKQALAEDMIRVLTPIRQRREELLADRDGLKHLLAKGAERAGAVAQAVMDEVRLKMGLR